MTDTLDAGDRAPHGLRHDWTLAEVEALFDLPFVDLIFRAQTELRRHFDPHDIQLSTLLSIKTGGCPEDCKYCPQSVHYDVGLEPQALNSVEHVMATAQQAQAAGATRFCMGAAWRSPTDRNLGRVVEMVEAVRDLGMETCVTLGMLTESHAQQLADAGLDYYNHNLDTSPEYYQTIVTTRTYQDRLDTLAEQPDGLEPLGAAPIRGRRHTQVDEFRSQERIGAVAPADTSPAGGGQFLRERAHGDRALARRHAWPLRGRPLGGDGGPSMRCGVPTKTVAVLRMPNAYGRRRRSTARRNALGSPYSASPTTPVICRPAARARRSSVRPSRHFS